MKSERIVLTAGGETAPRVRRTGARAAPVDSKQRLRLVVDAAARHFEVNGFHGTSLQDVADDVGITKAALYHYLDSKEHLLFLVQEAVVTAMLDSARAFVASHPDPLDQLTFYVTDILRTIARHRAYVAAFFRDYGVLSGELQAELGEKNSQYQQLVVDTLRDGMRSGRFSPDLDALDASFFLFGACNWSLTWMQDADTSRIDELAERWLRMLLGGFSPR